MKKKIAGAIALVLVLMAVSGVSATFTAPDHPSVPVEYSMASLGLSTADVRALEWDCRDAQEWIDNAVSEKVRRTKDRMVMATLQDPTALLMSDRNTIANMLSGTIVMSAQDIPENVQDYIVMSSLLKNAQQRTQEAEQMFLEPTPAPTPTPIEI